MSGKSRFRSTAKWIDFLLMPFFLAFAVGIPLIDTQTIFPPELFRSLPLLVELKDLFVKLFDYYLLTEKPHFYVGLAWLIVMLFWPLSVVSLWAMIARKPVYRIACFINGVNCATTTAAVLGEIIGSGRGSKRIYTLNAIFLLFSIIAIFRGLIPSAPFASAATAEASSKNVLEQEENSE